MNTRQAILVVDDEPFVRESLVALLQRAGFEALSAADGAVGLGLLQNGRVDAVLADLQMPAGGGLALLRAIRERGWNLPLVVITGVGTIEKAVEAMRGGAYDFVQKPVDPEQLVLLMRRALEHGRLERDVRRLRELVWGRPGASRLVGEGSLLRNLRELVARVAPTDATVLINGESGTGKELVAREIHASGAHAGGNLVLVNCAAIPEALFESELFGQRRLPGKGQGEERVGRFAEAEAGTLVLDQISALKPEMQVKLLRVLESGEYQVVGESRTRRADARIVAVTNEPLAERVKEGGFRADLFYRIAVFPIEVPPLRAHKEDLPAIAAHLLARLIHGTEVPPGAEDGCRLDHESLEVLASYDWPGNVRELRNLLERALIVSGGSMPRAPTLRTLLEPSLGATDGGSGGELHLRTRLDALEKELILAALERCGGRRKDAAALLGIDPRNMGYYLRKHDLTEIPGRRRAPER